VATGSILYLVGFIVAGTLRVGYPYVLESMEDANVQVVRQIAQGHPAYGPPTLDYVPVIYPPLYFYAAAGVAALTGASLVPLRLVSLLASLGSMALIYLMVGREVNSRVMGLLSAAVFVGSTQLSMTSLDLARVDALGVFLLLAALYAMRTADLDPRLAAWTSAASGVLAGLSILAKQTDALVAVALLGYAALSPRVRLVPYAAALVVSAGVPLAALYMQVGDWARYYLLDLPRAHELDDKSLGNFWTINVFPRFTLPLVIGSLFVVNRTVRGELRSGGFYLLASVSMLALAWGGWANRGASYNVCEPAFAMLSILFGLGLAEALSLVRGSSSELVSMQRYVLALGLVQFLILGYNPRVTVPLRSDIWAGDRLSARIGLLQGTVFAPGYGEWSRSGDKGDQPATSTIMEIAGAFGSQPTEPGSRLLNDLSNALVARRYDYVLFDKEHSDAFAIRGTIDSAGYVDAGPLFPPGDQFYEWKSSLTPEVELYVPRERLTSS
jgi:4-amino-4-deoxy-L-arabinose transferase-like glycosyltransferase